MSYPPHPTLQRGHAFIVVVVRMKLTHFPFRHETDDLQLKDQNKGRWKMEATWHSTDLCLRSRTKLTAVFTFQFGGNVAIKEMEDASSDVKSI